MQIGPLNSIGKTEIPEKCLESGSFVLNFPIDSITCLLTLNFVTTKGWYLLGTS